MAKSPEKVYSSLRELPCASGTCWKRVVHFVSKENSLSFWAAMLSTICRDGSLAKHRCRPFGSMALVKAFLSPKDRTEIFCVTNWFRTNWSIAPIEPYWTFISKNLRAAVSIDPFLSGKTTPPTPGRTKGRPSTWCTADVPLIRTPSSSPSCAVA